MATLQISQKYFQEMIPKVLLVLFFSSGLTVDTNQARISSSVDEVAGEQHNTGSEWDGLQGMTGTLFRVMTLKKGARDG